MSVIKDIKNIASAIRYMTGKSDKMLLSEMPDQIRSIYRGGVNHPDYYTKIELPQILYINTTYPAKDYPAYQTTIEIVES